MNPNLHLSLPTKDPASANKLLSSNRQREKNYQEIYRNPQKRDTEFKFWQQHGKLSNMEGVERLPGYSPVARNSVPYLITIQGVDQIAIEDTFLKNQDQTTVYGIPPGIK